MGAKNSKGEHWKKDSEVDECKNCGVLFSVARRRHHCRNCGHIFCSSCSKYRSVIPRRGMNVPVRVCAACFSTLQKCIGNNGAVPGDRMSFDGFFQTDSYDSTTCIYGSNKAFYEISTGSLVDDTAIDENGFSVVHNSPENEIAGSMSFNDQYTRSVENATSPQMLSEVTTDQKEKERLVHIWSGVRQKAMFIDVLFQQVERVDADTEVAYCREVENVRLQPEIPELLKIMFPFPQPAAGSVEMLLEPFDTRLPVLDKEDENVNDALNQLSMRLLKTSTVN